jgi:glycosyltransferase AglD
MAKVSIIIPFYNEEIILKKTANELNKYCLKNLPDFELIFVNDGSTDLSVKIIETLSGKYENIKLLSLKRHQGRGEAVSSGMKKAKGDMVGYIDCDLEIKAIYIKQAVKFLKKYDVVIASKFSPGAVVDTPRIRKVSSIVYNVMTRFLIGSKINDHQAGFKFFNKQIISQLLKKTKEQGWLWDTEVLYLAQKNNYNICELPINIKYGYRKLRPSFFFDFVKLPFVLIKLKRALDKR